MYCLVLCFDDTGVERLLTLHFIAYRSHHFHAHQAIQGHFMSCLEAESASVIVMLLCLLRFFLLFVTPANERARASCALYFSSTTFAEEDIIPFTPLHLRIFQLLLCR